jgi:hypothetical protein
MSLAQGGVDVSGAVTATDTARGLAALGSLSGTMNGRVLTFHVDVPTGGFSGTLATCAMSLDGQATISLDGQNLNGTYVGNLSGTMSGATAGQPCGGAISDGRFTLAR